MKISARNTLKGTIVEIKEGPVSTEVTIETGLKVGGTAYAVIKASSVMVAVDE